jgi:pimeloyl-ACP methyl ester carboxylesterase
MPARWMALLLLLVSTSALAAPDYAREKRWADEITPFIVVGDPIYLTQKNGHKFLGIYTKVSHAKMGVVVVHGLGVNPDWGMISTLRQRLPDYGYATLSIQMPVLAADAEPNGYAATIPDAVERLRLAVGYLKKEGYKRIAIVSHSMGSRMTYAYMKNNPADVDAWAALGMPAAPAGQAPALLYSGISAPILDLYGSKDRPQVLAGAALRRLSLAGNAASKQEVIAGADHFYTDHENEMVKAVRNFLDNVK